MGKVIRFPETHIGPERRRRLEGVITERSWEALIPFPRMRQAIREVIVERHAQIARWGDQDHVDPHEWLAILTEEVGEVAKPVADARVKDFRLQEYREELVQVAAVAVAAIEAIDSQQEVK